MNAAEPVRRGAGWVVAFKPAGVLIDADPARTPDTFRRTLAHSLGVPFRVCHPHTRIDQPVAGLTLWSLDAETRRGLVGATRAGRVRKLYLALTGRGGAPARPAPEATRPPPWRTRAGRPLTQAPETHAVPIVETATAVLWAVGIVAGKWHQIRLHLARLGSPVLGDRLHGGASRVVRPDGAVLAAPAVALEAVGIEFPAAGRVERVVAPPRSFLREGAAWAGLSAEALDEAAVARAWDSAWSAERLGPT